MEGAAEVLALYGRYAHCIDEGLAEEFAELFTSDGVSIVDGVERARGRAALAASVHAVREALPGVRHLVSSTTVEVDPDGERATGTAYVMAVTCGDGTLRLVVLGRYSDVFRREDGRWRIAEHRFEPLTGTDLRGAVLAG